MLTKQALILLLNCLFISFSIASASESLSYSGRLVNANGSPVSGPVNLKVDLAYSNAPTVILCNKTFNNVPLANGVFHLKLDLDCTPKTLTKVLLDVPATHAAAIRVTDLTNSKAYSFQSLHSIPYAAVAETAKKLGDLSATDGQFLKWNDTDKKWEPGSAGSGNGSVTEIATGAGLTGGPISGSGTISIIDGGVTDAKIASGISRTKLANGSADHVLINDGSGVISSVAQLPLSKGGTGAANAGDARTNLGLGSAAVANIGLGAGTVLSSTQVPECLPTQKLQMTLLPVNAWNCIADNDSADVTKLPLAGGQMGGTIDMNGNAITNLSAPVQLTDAATMGYVITQVDALDLQKQDNISSSTNLTTASLSSGEVRLQELSANGSNYVGLKSPDALGSNFLFTLPGSYGTSGQVLSTSGATGILSWVDMVTTGTSVGGDLTGTIANAQIGANAVGSTEIANGSITDAKVSAGANLDAAKIGTGVVSNTEFNSLDGVSSNIQTQLNSKLSSFTEVDPSVSAFAKDPLPTCGNGEVLKSDGTIFSCVTDNSGAGAFSGTADRVVTTDATGALETSTVTKAELAYVSGVTSGIQAQINSKQANLVSTSDLLGDQIRIYNGANYVEMRSPTLGGNVVLTLPTSDGDANQVLQTDGSGNLTWVNQSSFSVADGSVTYAKFNLADGDIPQAKVSGLVTALAGKEPSIPTGTTAQYIRGDKTLSTFTTDVINSVLTGFTSGSNNAITSSDTVLSAFGKTQGQLNAKLNSSSFVDWSTGGAQTLELSRLNFGLSNRAVVTNGLGTVAVSSTTATEVSYLSGVTSNVQAQLNTKLSGFTEADPSVSAFAKSALPTCGAGEVLKSDGTSFSCVTDNSGAGAFSGTADRVVTTDATGALETSTVTKAELAYVSGVTSGIQTQINSKQANLVSTSDLLGDQIRIYNGANYVEMRSPTLGGNVVLTLPTSDGDANQVLQTDGSGNLTWVNQSTFSIADGSVTYAKLDLADGDIPQAKVNGLVTALAGKEPTIPTGTTAQYIRGDKTLSTFATDVINSVLTGFTTGANSTILATDSVLEAFEKVQGQISAQGTSVSGKADQTNITQTITAATVTGLTTPVADSDATNKAYVEGRISGAANQWSEGSGNVYRSTGKIGVGTAIPAHQFTIQDNGVAEFDEYILGVHSNDANPFIAGFFNDEYSTTIPVFEYYANDDGTFFMGSPTANKIHFYTNGYSNPRMTIDGDGKVGIKNQSPLFDLDVEGDINIKGALYLSGSANGRVGFVPAASAGSTTYTLPSSDGASGQVLSTNGSGIMSWISPAGSVSSVFGRSGAVVATSGDYTATQIVNTAVGNIAATNVQTAINELDAEKEPVITAGTTAQYIRGDKTLSMFATDVINSVLTGFTTGANSTVLATDSVLGAFQKTQGQINALSAVDSNKLSKNTNDSITATVTVSGAGDIIVPSTPAGLTSAVNKTYVDNLVSTGVNQWSASSGNVYRSTGSVGIGTGTIAANTKLSVVGGRTMLQANSETYSLGLQYANGLGQYYIGATNSLTPDLVFSQVGGAERMRVTNAGSVGIGSSNPQALLDVNGQAWIREGGGGALPAAAGKGMKFEYNSTSDAGVIQAYDYATSVAKPLYLNSNGGNVVLNALGGNVGIGLTNPGYKLDVNGAINATSVLINGVAVGTGGTQWANGGSGAISYSGGNVGIGIAAPNYPLHISNADPVLGLRDSDSPASDIGMRSYITGRDSANTEVWWVGDGTGGDKRISLAAQDTSYTIALSHGMTPRLLIDTSGNISIGGTSAGSKLDVKGTLRLSGATSGYVGFAPATNAGSTTYTLPTADGTNGQVLSTNGSGVMSWISPAGSVSSVFGRSGAVVSASGDYTATQVTNTAAGNIAATNVQTAINELDTEKEPVITSGTSAQYIRGNKTLSTFATDVINSVLTGFITGADSTIVATDSVLGAFQKTQGQINALSAVDSNKLSKNTNDSITATVTVSGAGDIIVPSTPAGLTSAVNKTYVDNLVATGLNQWTALSGNVYRSTGSVGIGVTSPNSRLEVLTSTTTDGAFNKAITVGAAANAGQGGWIGSRTSGSNQRQGLMISSSQTLTLHGDNAGDGSSVLDILGGSSPDMAGDTNLLLRINSNGNVGIGTSNPHTAIHAAGVNGRITIGDTSETTGATTGIQFRSTAQSAGYTKGAILFENSGAGNGRGTFHFALNNSASITSVSKLDAKMTILDSGNVGIGTSTPGFSAIEGRTYLSIMGTNNAGATEYLTNQADADGVGVGLIQFTDKNSTAVNEKRVGAILGALDGTTANNRGGSLRFYTKTNNTDLAGSLVERMRIDNLGNVGIGTTGPTAPLSFPNTVGDKIHLYGGGTGSEYGFGVYSSEMRMFAGNTGNGNITFGKQANGTFTENMRITSNGSVGIGTPSPASRLNIVSGNGNTTGLRFGTPGTTGYFYNIYEQSATSGSISNSMVIEANGDVDYRQGLGTNNGSGNIVFMTGRGSSVGGSGATAEKMRINSYGFVGIGTPTPGTSLHVTGIGSGTTPAVSGSSDATMNARIGRSSVFTDFGMLDNGTGYIQNRQISNFAVNYNLALNPNGGFIGVGTIAPSTKFDVQGGVVNASGGFTQTSDIRLKTNIVRLDSKEALEKILSLDGIFFNWKDQKNEGSERQMGLIAQEVERAFPEAVRKNKKGMLSVSYPNLVAPIIESIKEVNSQTESLGREIASTKEENIKLKEKLVKVEKENAEIKARLLRLEKALLK